MSIGQDNRFVDWLSNVDIGK